MQQAASWARASSTPGSKGGHILGCMNRNVARRSREGIILPYSARLHAVSSFGPPSRGGTSETWSEFGEGLLETVISLVKAKIPEKTCICFMVRLNESAKTR